jgi:hypothetical protein
MTKIITATSVTKLGPEHAGQVVVGGSHGGIYAGYLAARAGCLAIILNDAGGGKDGAGFGSLAYLDDIAMPAATVAHDTARIGDGDDMLKRGLISHVNEAARKLGCNIGMTTDACAQAMRTAPPVTGDAPVYEEARFLFSAEDARPQIWGVDSASLVRAEDAGQIVLTASHGALLGGNPDNAFAVDVLACAFNDAGVGIDGIGITRLPALDQRGIAAVAVDCMTARIGDARSHWESGIISHANETAKGRGISAGQSLQDFATTIGDGHE